MWYQASCQRRTDLMASHGICFILTQAHSPSLRKGVWSEPCKLACAVCVGAVLKGVSIPSEIVRSAVYLHLRSQLSMLANVQGWLCRWSEVQLQSGTLYKLAAAFKPATARSRDTEHFQRICCASHHIVALYFQPNTNGYRL